MASNCFNTKKREGGRAWPHRQSGESRIVSKKNASPVLRLARFEVLTAVELSSGL
jgi:hypothetical protein